MNMNAKERLDLKKLVNEMDCDNNTESIRKLKHSVSIRNDIRQLEALKVKEADLRRTNSAAFAELARIQCSFLYNGYTDIFNKVLKDELDLTIMTKLLVVLKLIEDEQLDQHEGSVMVGKILKELYIDSAVKRADNLDQERNQERNQSEFSQETELKEEGRKISWLEYKKMV